MRGGGGEIPVESIQLFILHTGPERGISLTNFKRAAKGHQQAMLDRTRWFEEGRRWQQLQRRG